MKNERIKIWVNYKITSDVKKLLDNKLLILDDGGLSRDISRTLQSLRNSKRLVVGYDQRLKKSILAIDGVGNYRKRKHIGASIFSIDIE